MSRASFTIAYDGPALREGAMDVRDLAPALLAIGQLFDAANSALNHDAAQVAVTVKATGHGSFEIAFEVIQHLAAQITALFSSDHVVAAVNLKEFIVGGGGLFLLIKRLRGKRPDRIDRISENTVRITMGTESFDVPLELLRLYQDIAVRTAVQKVISDPLKREGIDSFQVRENHVPTLIIGKEESADFKKPDLPDEILIDAKRRAAFSIISLAFKEENKWRLYDGNTQISARIEDTDFLSKVDANQIAFAKGDILICDVRITQKRTVDGLTTEYVVEKVIEHRPALRQLPFNFNGQSDQ